MYAFLQPENILVDTSGKRLKLADFGSCRGINSKPPFTEYISTRWYRPPECLLTCGMYGAGMDIWGAGCILFELTTLYPLFPGADELDQINRIHRVLGTPSPSVLANLKKYASAQANFSFKQQHGIGLSKLLPDAKSHCLDLLTRSVEYDASKRIDSKGAINHPYFVGDVPIKPRISKAATKDSKVKQKPDSSTTSSSLASSNPDTTDKTSSGQSTSEETPVTKTRSMVSILLARVRTIICVLQLVRNEEYFFHDNYLMLFILLGWEIHRAIRRILSRKQRKEIKQYLGRRNNILRWQRLRLTKILEQQETTPCQN